MARQSELLSGTPVLLTRPRAESEGFAAALTARFGDRLRPVVSPLIAPRYLTPEIPAGNHLAVVFTSAHGVEGARRLGIELPRLAWCVGRKTAAAATAAGFLAKSADGTADDLVRMIRSEPPDGRILYLRGIDTSGNILEKLNELCIYGDVAIVYEQQAQPLSPEAIDLLRSARPVLVPLFSPRTAQLFQKALPKDHRAALYFVTISSSVAEALPGVAHAGLIVARHPDAPGMLEAVETLLADMSPP
jgi:uroporphyrinogen-III synthase